MSSSRRRMGYAGFLLAGLMLAGNYAAAQTASPTAQFGGPVASNDASGSRFKYALQRSLLSPTAYAASAAGAGLSMAMDMKADRGYGMGAEGFGRRFGDRVGTTLVSELTGSWMAASLLGLDPRYYPSGDPGFGRRAAHALRTVVIVRNDEGNKRFNTSGLIGIAAGAGASSAWHRPSDRSVRNYFIAVGGLTGFKALSNLAREFFRRK